MDQAGLKVQGMQMVSRRENAPEPSHVLVLALLLIGRKEHVLSHWLENVAQVIEASSKATQNKGFLSTNN